MVPLYIPPPHTFNNVLYKKYYRSVKLSEEVRVRKHGHPRLVGLPSRVVGRGRLFIGAKRTTNHGHVDKAEGVSVGYGHQEISRKFRAYPRKILGRCWEEQYSSRGVSFANVSNTILIDHILVYGGQVYSIDPWCWKCSLFAGDLIRNSLMYWV